MANDSANTTHSSSGSSGSSGSNSRINVNVRQNVHADRQKMSHPAGQRVEWEWQALRVDRQRIAAVASTERKCPPPTIDVADAL